MRDTNDPGKEIEVNGVRREPGHTSGPMHRHTRRFRLFPKAGSDEDRS
jgi:hypothetical protein